METKQIKYIIYETVPFSTLKEGDIFIHKDNPTLLLMKTEKIESDGILRQDHVSIFNGWSYFYSKDEEVIPVDQKPLEWWLREKKGGGD